MQPSVTVPNNQLNNQLQIVNYFSFSENNQSEEEKESNRCASDDLEVKEIHICKTREDPKAVCETCEKHKTRHKNIKDHIICNNVEELKSTNRYVVIA